MAYRGSRLTVSVRFFRLDRERIEQSLRDYAHRLAEGPVVLAVVLFGSLARGEGTAMSDADVLILLRDSPWPFHERTPHFLKSGVGISLDLFPYTLSEAIQALREGWGVVALALREGVWLVDKEGVRGRWLAISPPPFPTHSLCPGVQARGSCWNGLLSADSGNGLSGGGVHREGRGERRGGERDGLLSTDSGSGLNEGGYVQGGDVHRRLGRT